MRLDPRGSQGLWWAILILIPPVYVSRCVDHPTCETEPVVIAPSPATTTTIPPPQTPEPTAQASPSGVAGWGDLVAAYFPADQVAYALSIIDCESGGDPLAQNPSGATGLFQIMTPLWSNHFGLEPSDLLDPVTNVQVARLVWDQQGWGAWSCAT